MTRSCVSVIDANPFLPKLSVFMSDQSPSPRKVLLLGWDAADWKVINPLIDQGKMPNLARLVEGGVMGNIATLQPLLSPMLWTSIATGGLPELNTTSP